MQKRLYYCVSTKRWENIGASHHFLYSLRLTLIPATTTITTKMAGLVFNLFDLCDRVLYSGMFDALNCWFLTNEYCLPPIASPLAAITVMAGSLYWSAVCYGAFTVLQVFGHDKGKTLINEARTVYLLLGLPAIPFLLIATKLIRWENVILSLWCKNNFRYPLLGYVLGKPVDKPREYIERNLLPRDSDPIAHCRNFCSALFLPTAATVVGEILFGSFPNCVQRAVLVSL